MEEICLNYCKCKKLNSNVQNLKGWTTRLILCWSGEEMFHTWQCSELNCDYAVVVFEDDAWGPYIMLNMELAQLYAKQAS